MLNLLVTFFRRLGFYPIKEQNYIFKNFVLQVSLDSRVREIINKNMMSPTQRTFDEAQLQIYTLMHRDSYPRFVNSPIYRNLLKTYGGSVKDLTVTAAT